MIDCHACTSVGLDTEDSEARSKRLANSDSADWMAASIASCDSVSDKDRVIELFMGGWHCVSESRTSYYSRQVKVFTCHSCNYIYLAMRGR